MEESLEELITHSGIFLISVGMRYHVYCTNVGSAAQEWEIQTNMAKVKEHQTKLHAQLQAEGLAKQYEDGDGTSGKEGKRWKWFQRYKGDAGLPKEAASMKVYKSYWIVVMTPSDSAFRFL